MNLNFVNYANLSEIYEIDTKLEQSLNYYKE